MSAKRTIRAYLLAIVLIGVALHQVYLSTTIQHSQHSAAKFPDAPVLSISVQPDADLNNYSSRIVHQKYVALNPTIVSNSSKTINQQLLRQLERPRIVGKTADSTTTTSSSSSSSPYMRACMMVRDDNYFLAEWVAYHYMVLPLRHVIVGCDFDSVEDPMDVLGRWNDTDLQFQVWHSRYFAPNYRYKSNTSSSSSSEYHYVIRQSIFFSKCMQYFYQHDPDGWVALVDPDEFIKLNPLDGFTNFLLYEKNVTLPFSNFTLRHTLPFLVHDRNETIGDRLNARKELRQRMGLETAKQHQGGSLVKSQAPPFANLSVLTVLEEYSLEHGTLPCHAMPRRRYSAVIKNYAQVANNSCYPKLDPVILSSPFVNVSRLSTIQFLYYDSVEEWTKVLIDLRRIPWSALSDIEVRQNPHRPLHSCPGRMVVDLVSLIGINHYVNFWHVYGGRQKGAGSKSLSSAYARWSASAHHRVFTSCDQMHAWLNQLVTQFGMKRAMFLLFGVEG